ncbi:L,D-transpeptidase family protein [Candidatus Omnitrophota bacterium]
MFSNRIFLVFTAFIVVVVTIISFVALKKAHEKAENVIRLDKAELVYNKAEDYLRRNEADKAKNALLVVISQYPHSKYAEESLRKMAAISKTAGDYDKAAYYYKRLLKDFPDTEGADKIKVSIEELNMKHMASTVRTEDSVEYEVRSGDSLYAIARKYNTTVGLIKKINGLENDLIRVGQKLKVNIAKFSILVNKAENILILKKDGESFKTYKVATGKENSTPVGKFTIVDKMVKPAWTKPGAGIIMPDDEEYELGARWMPISVPGYGIHGTNDESSIGKQLTAGCVRMHNEDVIELYDIVPKGTVVEIIDGTEVTDVPVEKTESAR